jgi:DNA-binding GntR family transcriptional regulator
MVDSPDLEHLRVRRHQQLSTEVANYVREQILSGQLRPGSFIRQEKIAEDLELSATPVREGLLALRGEGFVLLKPRRGFMVAPLSADDIRDLFSAQALIAGELAARAVPRLDDLRLDELEAIHQALIEAADSDDPERVEQLNHAFHRSINLAAGAPKLAWVLSLTARFAPHQFFATIEGWAAASAHDHQAVVAALRAGDAERARQAMRLHIEHAGELLAEHFATIVAGAAGDEQPAD